MSDEPPNDHRTRPTKPFYEGPSHSAPYPMSRLAPRHDLVDVAREIEKADAVLGAVVQGQLGVIVDQIRALQAQARSILEAANRSRDLHSVACNFEKRPGQTYHLYQRPSGQLYFSLLSPHDWAGSPPHTFEGSFRLELDMSWTPAERVDERDHKAGELAKLLGPK